MTHTVTLRDVIDNDLPIFYEQQADPIANDMAAFPARDRESFNAHWQKIRRDDNVTLKTILADGQVAGNIVKFIDSDQTLIGYWLGRDYWGNGIATQALAKFLELIETRPVYAQVAKHNNASRRVLEKCGFTIIVQEIRLSESGQSDGADFILELSAIDHA